MPYQDESLNQLIINKLSQEQYNELAEAGTISANQLYFVEAPGNIDAASGTIENVADPINATDAANKRYVDNTISGNLTNLSSIVSANYATISSVTNLSNSLSGYPTNSNVNSISSTLNNNITYVSSQVSGLPFDITYVSSSLSSYTPLTTSNDISSLLNVDITYVSGQVSEIPLIITSLSSTVSSDYALKTAIPTAETLGLSNYAAVSTVTNLSNELIGYSKNSDVTYISSQVSGLPDNILEVSNSLSSYTTLTTSNDISSTLNNNITYVSSQVSGLSPTITGLSSEISSNYATTATVENINNSLSGFVPYSTSGTLEFTPIQGIQYGKLSANADGISSYFSQGGNTDSFYESFSLIGTSSPKLRFWSANEEYGELSNSAETIYENGSITYNNNQLIFPEEPGTLVVNSQLSSYSLSSDVSSTINKISNIASSLSALSDINQIPAEYTIDTVVQKLNEVIIRINTLTTTLK